MNFADHTRASHVARQISTGTDVAPGNHGRITVLDAQIRTGLAVPLMTRGVVHRVARAAIVNDERSSMLAVRYVCGAGTGNARAITAEES
ncbi:MAG TPA: hypothetical protein VJ782_01845, partial [Aeromicrobium sp.]|nr:hypothetical protein [Aeromicrobium sp.]